VRSAAPWAFFLAASLIFTYPLSTEMGSRALDLGPDTRLFLWTLGWDTHAFQTAPLAIFDANIFHPEKRTLAFSEHQIGSALLAAPFVWATGNLVLAMNAVAILSVFLSGGFAYVLARELGLSRSSALLAGAIFAFSPPRFFRLGQLHLATVEWIPLCLALLHRYPKSGRRRHLVAAAFVFWLQALSGGQSALFLAFAAGGLLIFLWMAAELPRKEVFWKDALAAGSMALALNLPFVLPYLEVRRELGLERSLEEAVYWSPNAVSYLTSPAHLHRWMGSSLGMEGAKAFLFPGFIPMGLALVALFRGREAEPRTASPSRWLLFLDLAIVLASAAAIAIEAAGGFRSSLGGLRFSALDGSRAALLGIAALVLRFVLYGRTRSPFLPNLRSPGGYYLALGVFSFWVSLGPRAGLYSLLYRLVPGFDFLRVPPRFTVLTVLAIAVLAGMGAERLALRVRGALLVLLLFELAAFPLDAPRYQVIVSPMDLALAGMDPGPLAAFPIPDPRDGVAAASRHSLYMLQSTAHFLPLVNGYSGFTPEGHDRLFRILASFPNENGILELEKLSVRYAVFHRDGYSAAEWSSLLERIESFSDRLEPRKTFEEGRVYEITRARPDRESSRASRSRSSSSRRASAREPLRPLPYREALSRWGRWWR
jgi:hypothetical protein